jgi:hypothetical protein
LQANSTQTGRNRGFPKDFAALGLKAWGSWWKGRDIPAYLRKICICFSTDIDFKMEILKETEDWIYFSINEKNRYGFL